MDDEQRWGAWWFRRYLAPTTRVIVWRKPVRGEPSDYHYLNYFKLELCVHYTGGQFKLWLTPKSGDAYTNIKRRSICLRLQRKTFYLRLHYVG